MRFNIILNESRFCSKLIKKRRCTLLSGRGVGDE